MVNRDYTDQRQSYERGELTEASLAGDPQLQLAQWLDEAVAAALPEPYAMMVATAGQDGQPTVRTVLLRELDERGLVFYSHYDSEKGQQLAANPHAEFLFYWAGLERQVRVRGRVTPLDAAESDAYFAKRPRSSQIAAHASTPQSGLIATREVLEQQFADIEQQFGEQAVPRPERWGGYRLQPVRYEFWQGRRNRVHDRICYVRSDSPVTQPAQADSPVAVQWELQRLMP